MRQLILFVFLAFATGSALCREIIHLDLRSNKSGPKYSVAFAAEKSRAPEELGHAFVVWYKEDANANASLSNAAGFYPQTDQAKKDFSLVLQTSKGKVFDDAQSKRDIQLIVTVSEETYKNSLKVLERWKDSKKRYGILLNDCVSFAQEVAISIGLIAPSRAYNPYPFDYLRALIDKNTEKETTSIRQSIQTVLESAAPRTGLIEKLGPVVHTIYTGVIEGPIVERCIYSWSDSHNFHSSRTEINLNYQATKTTWKRLDHCMKLTVNGPIDAKAIAKSYVEKCVRDAINNDRNRHLFELLVAIGVDVAAEGATGFAATTAKAADYANSVRKDAMECLTSSTKMEDYVAKALKDSFGAKIELVSNWVYWDL